MSNLKIGIIEDEMIIAEALSAMLQSIGYEIPEPASNYHEAIELIENEKPDLVLLDINLSSHLSGIDLAKTINEKYKLPYIFLTANTDAATVELAKAVNPMAYLAKPITKDQLYSAIEIAIHNFNTETTLAALVTENKVPLHDVIFIKEGYAFRKVQPKDITHIESEANYVVLHFNDGSKLMTRSTLSTFVEQLDPQIFVRVHRSFFVNIHHIEGVYPLDIKLKTGKIPISKNYRDDFLKVLGISDSSTT